MTSDIGEQFRRRHYQDPPVVEAVARLHLAEPIAWTLTTPGLLYSRLIDAYPQEPQFQNVMQAEFASGDGGTNPPNVQLKSGPQKVVFGADDGSKLLIVGASDISAHGLPPYEGWESLEERLFTSLDLMSDFIPRKQFIGLGVRYINRVVIPKTEFRFDDYLTIGFTTPPGFPENVSAFLDRIESVYPDGHARLSFTWATADAPDGSSAFILDFDLNWASSEELSIEEARVELGALKKKETAAFESLLQKPLREIFHEVT